MTKMHQFFFNWNQIETRRIERPTFNVFERKQ